MLGNEIFSLNLLNANGLAIVDVGITCINCIYLLYLLYIFSLFQLQSFYFRQERRNAIWQKQLAIEGQCGQHTPLIQALGGQRETYLCQFQATLGCTQLIKSKKERAMRCQLPPSIPILGRWSQKGRERNIMKEDTGVHGIQSEYLQRLNHCFGLRQR